MILLKKIQIELWVLCLVGVLLFIGLVGFGSLVRHEIQTSVSRFPILSSTALSIAEIPSNLKTIIRGQSFDLLADEQRFRTVSGFYGKHLEDETYLLLSKYDGDIERGVVELVDLRSFEVKKTWSPDINQINDLVDTSQPEFEHLKRDSNVKRYAMVNPYLTEDGGLIFHDMYSPLIKIDKNSQLVWQNQEDVFHHSIEQDHEENFWIPTSIYPYQVDKKYVGSEYDTYVDDAITKVSADGEILFHKSVTNILIENNFIFSDFQSNVDFTRDPIHLNDIQPALSDGPHWKQGDVFLSLRNQSMIILYRPSTNKIIWRGGQPNFSLQHDVDILDDHRISIFNNNVKKSCDAEKIDGNNEVVIYDFKTDLYSKYLDESLIQNDVRTITEGSNQIIDNNDLFIEETTHGRILYFNKDRSLQWQYVNRANNGKVYIVKWSRILYTPEDIKKVRKILEIEN